MKRTEIVFEMNANVNHTGTIIVITTKHATQNTVIRPYVIQFAEFPNQLTR